MTTVCAMTIRGVSLAWVIRIDLADSKQGWPVRIRRAQGSSCPALPGFLVLGVRFVPQCSPPSSSSVMRGSANRVVVGLTASSLGQRTVKPGC